MITEFFLNCLFGLAEGFFELMPEVSWTVETTAWEYVKDILDMVAYLLPIDTIVTVASLIVSLTIWRIVISFIRTLWGLIPFV